MGALLEDKQLLMREGTLVDASIIAAPCSTKNRRRERDPEPERSEERRPCPHSQKQSANAPDQERQPVVFRDESTSAEGRICLRHDIGADEASGLVHSVEGTAANVSDISQSGGCRMLHGEEKRAEIAALGRDLEWRVAARRSTHKAQPEGWAKAIGGAWEKLKARARAVVEHPFHIVKNIFRHRKVRCRGLEKNTSQLRVLFALASLCMVRRQLIAAA